MQANAPARRATNRVAWMLPVLCLLLVAGHAAAQAPMRVLPLGDSITYGSGTPGGYRNKLFQTLTAAGYNVDFVGNETTNGVGSLPDLDHEGHGGWTIDGIDEKVQDWLSLIDAPDVILLHIGTNDFGYDVDTENAINRLAALITTIATHRPYAHIVVTNLMERDEPENGLIQEQFNPFVEDIVDAQAALGRKVSFLDIRSAVPLSEMPDNLHPDQTGYDHMADAWAPAIQSLIGPHGDSYPPAIVRAQGNPDRTHVAIAFSKPVADSAATVGNFTIDNELTVTAAELDGSKRVVTLTTSEYEPNVTYSVTVNGVVDRTAAMLALPADSSVEFFFPTPRGYPNHVPESVDYTLACSLDLPTVARYGSESVEYTFDNRELFGDFSRIAYYLELQHGDDDLKYVWASMDAFTADADRIAVPTAASGAVFQQGVTNLNVVSNVPGISTTGSAGNLEFWPTGYAKENSAAVPGAGDDIFDFGDTRLLTGAYGTMQLHDTAAGQTIFAFNNWGGSGTHGHVDLGIGNSPNAGGNSMDWTYERNAAIYAVKTLQVLVRTSGDIMPPSLLSATSFGGTYISVRFSEPLALASVHPANFTLDGGVAVLSATLGANQRDVNLTTSMQPAGTALTLTVNGVTDSSPQANPVLRDSSIEVLSSVAQAGVVKLKLREMLPGSETVTLVNNGNFENNSTQNNHTPVGWMRSGDMFYDGHAGIAVPGEMGANSARIHTDGGNFGHYDQNLALVAHTDYVLSGYLWHLGNPTHTGTVELDLNDRPYEPDDGGGSIAISQNDPEAYDGYFVYAPFNPGSETSAKLRAFMVFSETDGWPNQPTGALWDNIAITPAASFVPPSIVTCPIEISSFSHDKASDLMMLQWTSEPRRSYSVFYSTDGLDWTNQLAGSISSEGRLSSYGPFSDPAPGSSLVFFRIQHD